MDETLEALLVALDGLDAPSASDRANVLGVLVLTLPELDHISQAEWQAKLARVEDDVELLGEAAGKAASRFDQGRRVLETLTTYAERHGNIAAERATFALTDSDTNEILETDLRYKELVAQAETTRDAIVTVMARRPQRAWTAGNVWDALFAYDRRVTRANVQVSLRRLAEDGLVDKVGRGTYQVVSDALTGPPGQQVPDRQAEINRKARIRRDAARRATLTKKRKREKQDGP